MPAKRDTINEPRWTVGFNLANFLQVKKAPSNREVADKLGLSEPSFYAYLKKNSVPYAVFLRLQDLYGPCSGIVHWTRKFPSFLPARYYAKYVPDDIPQTETEVKPPPAAVTDVTGPYRDTIRVFLELLADSTGELVGLRRDIARLQRDNERLQQELDSALKLLDEQTTPTAASTVPPQLAPVVVTLAEEMTPAARDTALAALDAALGKFRGPKP